jgi:hypothetical protein
MLDKPWWWMFLLILLLVPITPFVVLDMLTNRRIKPLDWLVDYYFDNILISILFLK